MAIERIFRSTKDGGADTGNACGPGLRHGLNLKRARCRRVAAVRKPSKCCSDATTNFGDPIIRGAVRVHHVMPKPCSQIMSVSWTIALPLGVIKCGYAIQRGCRYGCVRCVTVSEHAGKPRLAPAISRTIAATSRV